MLDTIKDFIVRNFLFGDAGTLTHDTLLLENEVVDSTGLLEIIEFLETTFSITIEDHELLPQNLDTIKNIAQFVSNKKGNEQCAV